MSRRSAPVVPKYRRIAEDLRAEIEAGRYAPGDRLPSLAELIAGSGASLGTVLKAIATLESEGLVRSVRGQGIFVVTDPAGEAELIAGLHAEIRRLRARLAEHEQDHHVTKKAPEGFPQGRGHFRGGH